MKKHDHKSDWVQPETVNVSNSVLNEIPTFFDRVRAVSLLHIIAGLSQVFMGITVVTIALMGFIQPFWLSTFVSIIAGITTTIGMYMVFITVLGVNDRQDVIRNAMKRVIEARN